MICLLIASYVLAFMVKHQICISLHFSQKSSFFDKTRRKNFWLPKEKSQKQLKCIKYRKIQALFLPKNNSIMPEIEIILYKILFSQNKMCFRFLLSQLSAKFRRRIEIWSYKFHLFWLNEKRVWTSGNLLFLYILAKTRTSRLRMPNK